MIVHFQILTQLVYHFVMYLKIEMENFTGNSNLETQTGCIEIVNVTNEGVQSASHDDGMILLCILVLFACYKERRDLFMMQA